MKKADSVDPKKYLPVLAKIERDGVTGKIAFDAKGDIKGGAVTLYRVKDKDWAPLEIKGGEKAAAAETPSKSALSAGY